MKRFDKGYIYSSLLTDFLGSLLILFVFFEDFFFGDESNPVDIAAAIPVFVIAFVVIYSCFIAYRIMYYRTSGYEFSEKEIKCNRGVFFRKRSLLEYNKIHAVNKKQHIVQKIFGIAVLTVDSGSANTSHQAEITIIEKEKTVDALLKKLNALKKNKRLESDIAEEKEEVLLSENDSLYSFTSKKKILYTLINIATTAFFMVLFGVLLIIALSVCKLIVKGDFLGTWGQYFFFAVLITLGATLLFSLFSFIIFIINSFVGYYNFFITKRGNDIQISYGLLERHTNTFSCDRIKAVKISQGIVQRILGFASIRLEVIGYTVGSGEDAKDAGLGVLVPFCKYDEVGEILGKVLPDYVPEKKQTNSVSYFPFVSWFSLILGIIAGVVLFEVVIPMSIFNVSSSVIGVATFAVIIAAALAFAVKATDSALAYKNNGLAINGEKITAFYGGLTKNVTVFMSKNLIAAENLTTPLRQKAGITTLVMHLRTNAQSNEIKVHIQKEELSDEIEHLLTF